MIALFVGAAINFLKNSRNKNFLEYNYSKDDSLFFGYQLSQNDSTEKYVNLGVDYQWELLDFSNEKLKENINKEKKDTFKLVNINSANFSELISLPGIGEKTAIEIINYRKNSGAFNNINDLLKIKGIGKSKLDKIKSRITFK
ncbi:MAG: ComEA family DNA-binding protein [Melioribacter sp.]|uniref:ComEA family DNA-binding protein n=1 Tax=Rosettibacter primus TaxID=3111523 RepID=UPI00247CBBDC|nr:ComEA family DNA-binding protein [Melioribacter sp.]